jgi:hypothetical protein
MGGHDRPCDDCCVGCVRTIRLAVPAQGPAGSQGWCDGRRARGGSSLQLWGGGGWQQCASVGAAASPGRRAKGRTGQGHAPPAACRCWCISCSGQQVWNPGACLHPLPHSGHRVGCQRVVDLLRGGAVRASGVQHRDTGLLQQLHRGADRRGVYSSSSRGGRAGGRGRGEDGEHAGLLSAPSCRSNSWWVSRVPACGSWGNGCPQATAVDAATQATRQQGTFWTSWPAGHFT